MAENKFQNVDVLEGHTPLAPDEPVFVLRAKDRFMPDILSIYALMCEDGGSPEEHVDAVRQHRLAALEWQRHNGCRLPD